MPGETQTSTLGGDGAAFGAVLGSTGWDLLRTGQPAPVLGEAPPEITRLWAAFLGGQDNAGGKAVRWGGDKLPCSELLPLFPWLCWAPEHPSSALLQAAGSLWALQCPYGSAGERHLGVMAWLWR